MSQQPNVIFIVLDTQRRDRLSLYGHDGNTSPHLDDFAQGATVFERAISPAQWTIPAHGSLFTGLYPGTHQLTQAFQQLNLMHPTLAEILRVADYQTVAFCNNPLLGILDHGLQRGFDEFYNYSGASPNRPIDLKRSALQRQLIAAFRRFARRVTNRFAHNSALFHLSLHPLLVPFLTRYVNFKGHSERSVDDFIAYWQQVHAGGNEKPVFAYLNLMATHTPYTPPPQFLDQVAPGLRHDKHATRYISQFNANGMDWISPLEEPLHEWQIAATNAYYDAEIAYQDTYLGRLFDYLRDSGTLDNTLVIVAADHGEGHGDHGYRGHSFVVYQELVHVPLIIHYPERFPAGKRITTNVSTRRLFHTILDVVGVAPPLAEDDPNADVGHRSLISVLNGRPDVERNTAFSEAIPPLTLLSIIERNNPAIVEALHLKHTRRGIYQGDHKLALVGDEVEKLFNVADDPQESQSLTMQQPSLVDALKGEMQTFIHSTQAQRVGAVEQVGGVSDEVRDNLRALGYMD